jgi:hypothetical protein
MNLVESGSSHPRAMARHIALTSDWGMRCNISALSRWTASHQWTQYRIANAFDFTLQWCQVFLDLLRSHLTKRSWDTEIQVQGTISPFFGREELAINVG